MPQIRAVFGPQIRAVFGEGMGVDG